MSWFLHTEHFKLLLFIFLELYDDCSAIGLLIKFEDIFPCYAQDCFIFDKLLFQNSRVIYYHPNITWELIFRLNKSQICCPFRY